MKKIDNVIRFIFLLGIFELSFLQILIYFHLITTVIDYAIETVALFIINIIVYGVFILYNFIIFLLNKFFIKKNSFVFELSRKQVIASLILSTCFIIISICML